MTHSYTVCEQRYDLQMNGMPHDDSRISGNIGCGGSSSRGEHFFRHDPLEEELDPCLSAAVRYKKEKSNTFYQMRYCLCCLIVILAIALLAFIFYLIFDSMAIAYNSKKRISAIQDGKEESKPLQMLEVIMTINLESIYSNGIRIIKDLEPHIRTGEPKPEPTTKQKTQAPVMTRPTFTSTSSTTTRKTTTKRRPSVTRPTTSITTRKLMSSDHGWIILQRRTGAKLPFWNATFEQYARGFGDSDGDFWLGLERVHEFASRVHKLEMGIRLHGDLCDAKTCSGLGDLGMWWGDWEFTIGNRSDHYRIKELRYLRGNISDPSKPEQEYFSQLCNNQKFTTVDEDHDNNKLSNCAKLSKRGAWWHRDCAMTALNGEYGDHKNRAYGQFWKWKSPTENITMMSYNIKPKSSLILFRVLE